MLSQMLHVIVLRSTDWCVFMRQARGLSYKKVCFKRPKVLVIVRVWDVSQQCETSQTLNLRFKRPKLWDVSNVFSYRRDLWKRTDLLVNVGTFRNVTFYTTDPRTNFAITVAIIFHTTNSQGICRSVNLHYSKCFTDIVTTDS